MDNFKTSQYAKLNFSNGFTLFTSIKIRPQKHEGRKVIFQIAHITTPLRITFGLNNNNDLMVWLEDTQGQSFESKPVDKKLFFQKSVFLHFSVIPSKQNGELPKLELGVDDYVDQTEIKANLGSDDAITYSIGGNLDGKENAAFDMAALSLYNIVLSLDQIKAISNALVKEWGA